ncbi:hypothetical protein Agub_g8423, partial [Astrephomene gubernaculifera]
MGSSFSSCVEPGPVFALFQAVRQGDLQAIKFRLNLDPELLNYRNLGDRDTVWHLAASSGSETVLAVLHEAAQAAAEQQGQRQQGGTEGRRVASVNCRNGKG